MASRDPAYAIQVAVSAALMASPDLAAVFGGAPRVWDRVPADSATQQADFPYLTIGEDQLIGKTNQNTDVTEVWVKVEAWSRAANKGEVKLIAGAVRTALDTYLDLSSNGHGVIAHTFHNVIYRREPDGLTERAIITQHYLTAPIGALNYSGF